MSKGTKFQLTFPENLKRDTNLSTTSKLSFDDLGDFIEERERIKRTLERSIETNLKIDYSNFANHVFFDSAVSKFDIAKKRILEQYSFNGTAEEKDAFNLTGSGYENYIFEQWPRSVGYLELNGTSQYVSASDVDNDLHLGSSSLYVSAWIRPKISTQNIILQILSASEPSPLDSPTAPLRYGYELYLSGALSPHIKFSLYSGSSVASVSASYSQFTASFNNVAAIYDNSQNLLSIYINGSKISSGAVSFNPVEFSTVKVLVGSGSRNWVPASASNYDFYSGSLNEVRVFHTASELFHTKNYSRPIDSENYVVLRYSFNEGTTGTGSVDSVVVDYSKSRIHGNFVGYTSSARVSGAVMLQDSGDPILYSFHSGVIAFTSSVDLSASSYDRNNNNQIFNMIPESVLVEDEDAEGLYRLFALGMARFFDQTKLYIDQFDNLRAVNYDDKDETPDLFLPHLARYFGWKVTEHFGDTNPLEFLFGEGILATGSLEVPLIEIRNQFWRRILNNMPYLLSTKGKRNNLDSFFNVLGVNRENINIKEYGYLPGGSIEDTRIHKDKVVPLLGIGTGSFSASFVKAPLLITGSNSTYTIEALAQLPFASASYSASLSVLTGAIWQLIDPEQVTGSFTLLWNIPSLKSSTGKFVLTGSDGQQFSSSLVEVFDGDIVYLAAGLKENQIPFIEVRTIDNDRIDLSSSFVGITALSGVFTGSKYDFIMGASSGSIFTNRTQGFYGEYRYWNRALSASEVDAHALHFENVGVRDPLEVPHPLRAHWPLNENKATDSAGRINGVIDLSRNGNIATGSQFLGDHNPYDKFLLEYNYLSPSIDLKWTENKIRIRNKTFLKKSEIANDTNEVSLEFNLVDALNEDITKIFSTFNLLNDIIGRPINKYRDEYAELEGIRRSYFERLGDSINFTNFFKLFRWFDKKISDSIKQLLPARVKFIGGEQIVESHFLERPRYQYKYPIFRTPADIPETAVTTSAVVSGNVMETFSSDSPSLLLGTTNRTLAEGNRALGFVAEKSSSVSLDVFCALLPNTTFSNSEKVDRNSNNFFRIKISGDSSDDINDPNSGVNFRDEFARNELLKKDRDNE